ncbi:hypothetical protein [Prevotella intermedia]|uniref:hypothetical protein n=1 Tax=Prevotella intermedia TaxID=28131 RepID=UPI0013A6F01B|nr:hypothetical protein [Prevotella intermedia]
MEEENENKKMLKRSALAFFCWCMKGGVVKGEQGCVGFLVLREFLGFLKTTRWKKASLL